jgi:exosortase
MVGMWEQWSTDEDMAHGFAVPLFAGWLVWRQRERLGNIAPAPSLWGFAVLAAGAGLHLAALLGAGLFAGALGFLISLTGTILALGGWQMLRALGFPLALLVFMLPKLAVVYNQATLPLQLISSRLAAWALSSLGIGVIREGNILEVFGRRIEVAEACNGLRYLLALGFLSQIYGHLMSSKPWVRLLLLAAAFPIAIVANAARVGISAAVPALMSGTPHLVTGLILFTLCIALLGVFAAVLNWIGDAIRR